jgi:signal recognition particle subunit SRP54
MFESLSSKLNDVFQRLGNKGRLTEKDIENALKEVRMALLEADVNFRVSRDLISRIKERALAEDIVKSLSPGQQVIKITNDELTKTLGGTVKELTKAADKPSVMLVVGLNGSGKTTTVAKLAYRLGQASQTSVLVAADRHRPAAVEQLETLGEAIDTPVYRGEEDSSSINVCKNGIDHARKLQVDWAIVDTAGRFQIDDDLMEELQEIKNTISPQETLMVVDAMIGQEAVAAAQRFHEKIGLTGIVLSKLDGDARGGAALSITSVTGVPVKYIGVGERSNALEEFIPDRLASRILGMGDVLTLIEKTQSTVSEEQALELEKKIRQATFDLEDFLGQLQQLKKMGPLNQILDMIPGMASLKQQTSAQSLDGDQLKKVEAIVYSMTPVERQRPDTIDGSRRRRIANGSGTTPQDVNRLLNQFKQMQKQMKRLTTMKGRRDVMRMMKQGNNGNPFGI